MEGLLRQMSNYGPTLIRFTHNYWTCACEVSLPGHSELTQVAKTTGPDLYKTIRELLKQSAITRKRLMDKLHAPKQEAFQYGSKNKEWKEIA